MTTLWFKVVVFFLLCIATLPVHAEEANPVVQLTNRLGVTVIDEVKMIHSDDSLLDSVFSKYYFLVIPSGWDKGNYTVVPLCLLKNATKNRSKHILTLNDGHQLIGNITGYCEFIDGRSYDLDSATEIISISCNKTSTSTAQELDFDTQSSNNNSWQIQLAYPKYAVDSVRNPRFIFHYWTREGIIFDYLPQFDPITGSLKQESRNKISDSFYLRSGNEETHAYLSDFKEIVFEGDAIRVKAKNGIETVGELILKAEDSMGYHEATSWVLVMDSTGSDTKIVIQNPRCSLRKEAVS